MARIDVDDPVELDLNLPGHPAIGRRAMHCLGKVIQTSRDVNGQLWLVVRFHQIQIRSIGDEDVIDPALASIQATERGDRSRGVAE